MSFTADIGRQLLFLLQPETAHGLAIRALSAGLVPAPPPVRDKRLETRVANLILPNPIGMAAGFDKDAEVPNALLQLGFGFVEIGTVTPKPQAGNPQPRIFRLPEDEAVINRLGFNNRGHEAALAKLKKRSRRAGIVGVNIGANKDSDDRVADYAAGIKTFATVADYFTINVSSPNTPGLRDLQARESLAELLKSVTAAREAAASITGKRLSVFLKIAPDLDEAALDDVAEMALAHAIEGVIVSNTTLSRVGLTDSDKARETGGLSGRPLFERSTIMLARLRRRVGTSLVLIGVGGVDSAEAALTKIKAGADLVQLYTGLIYRGPAVAHDITKGLVERLDADGVAVIADYRDTEVDAWADLALTA
ncbi:quinone-dependent dihydroorotate dehydrogenase [Georhizobium sp. MAB10]|uniref:quinone-dependent dihydroorotate dehydrogenase n=1 Tax=Georhizobium sp. MAB10 TaxID=3028319 RepID=UPI00385575AC